MFEKRQLVDTCRWETMEKKAGSSHAGYHLCLFDLYSVLFAFARLFRWDFCLPDLFVTSPLTISCQTRMSLPLFVSTVYSVGPRLPFGFLSSVFTLLFVYRACGFTLGSCCRAFHNSAYHWEQMGGLRRASDWWDGAVLSFSNSRYVPVLCLVPGTLPALN